MATEVSATISVKRGSSSLLTVPLKRPKEGIMAQNVKKRKADEQLGPRHGKRPQLVLTPKGRVEPILSDTSTLPYDYSDITYGPEDNTALGAFEEGPNLSDEDDVDSLAGEEGDLPHRPTDPMRDDMPIVTSRWQKEEVDALMTAMNINRDAIKFHFDGPGGGVDVKRQAWRDVATYVNDIAQTHRTVQQCRNKVDDYTQRVKGKYNKLRQAVGQTGRGTIKQGMRLKAIEHKALDYLREEAVRGIPGLKPISLGGPKPEKPSRQNRKLLWRPNRSSKPDYDKIEMARQGVPKNYKDKNNRRVAKEAKSKRKMEHAQSMLKERALEKKEAKAIKLEKKQLEKVAQKEERRQKSKARKIEKRLEEKRLRKEARAEKKKKKIGRREKKDRKRKAEKEERKAAKEERRDARKKRRELRELKRIAKKNKTEKTKANKGKKSTTKKEGQKVSKK